MASIQMHAGVEDAVFPGLTIGSLWQVFKQQQNMNMHVAVDADRLYIS